jgi:alpha-N-acetylglucosamine transferase
MKRLNLKKVLGLGIATILLVSTITLGMKTYKNYILENEYNNSFTELQQLEELYKLMYAIEENDNYIVELEYYLNNYDIQVLTLYKECNNTSNKYLVQAETIDGEPIELEILTNKQGIIENIVTEE